MAKYYYNLTVNPFIQCKMNRFWIIIAFLSFVGTACSEMKDGPAEKAITVALKLSGDYDLEVTQDPLSKAASTDAYGINVYYDKESDGQTNDVYAYGLFDNVPAMSITLLSGHKYRFACALVKDAKNVLYYGQAFNNSYSGYAYPFKTSSSGSTQLGNRFIINENNVYLSGIGSGGVHLKATSSPSSSNASNYASVNRFYGETDQYTPVPNGTVDIYLKRVVFGVKFVVNGVQEGSVKVTCGDFYNRTYSADDAGTEKIYTVLKPYDCWNWEKSNPNQTYSFSATCSIAYTSDRGGTLWNLSNSQTITFKRNVMTTVTINLSPDLSGAMFTLTEEPMGDDNDINIGIDGNSLIDINVNPND